MPGTLHSLRHHRVAMAALFLLLAATWSASRPETVLALGGPWPVTVVVEGEVRHPGAYTLPPGATLSSLILAAGGATGSANLGGAALFRASVRANQEKELTRTIEELSRECNDPEGADDPLRAILAFLRELRPSGRVPVRVTFPRLMKNSPDDLRLEEGDTLRIPPMADTVAVAGAVRNPADNVPFLPGRPFEEYIRTAGGYSGDADRDRVYLLRTDGKAVLLTPGPVSWNPAAARWEVTALVDTLPAVGPGDAIVVSRALPPGVPREASRKLRRALARAMEIAGTPAVPPGAP